MTHWVPIWLKSDLNLTPLCLLPTTIFHLFLTQRRNSSVVDFYRGWSEYQNGFGDVRGNFWAGLNIVHAVCSQVIKPLKFVITVFLNALIIL